MKFDELKLEFEKCQKEIEKNTNKFIKENKKEFNKWITTLTEKRNVSIQLDDYLTYDGWIRLSTDGFIELPESLKPFIKIKNIKSDFMKDLIIDAIDDSSDLMHYIRRSPESLALQNEYKSIEKSVKNLCKKNNLDSEIVLDYIHNILE